MVPQSRSGGDGRDGIDETSAKNLLDSIGEKVYKEKVQSEAENYIDDLKGKLKEAKGMGLTGDTTDTCTLVEQYYERVNKVGAPGERYPCKGLSEINVERFSNKIGGQCTNEKMRSGGKGACAPYRRLHLCHHNLESIDTDKIDNTHKLLLEVCMAAKYEGKSITGYYPIYQEKYGDLGSTICTVLARSFADIGDIVRGKDLFYGNPQEKEKRDELEKNLKTIFDKIKKSDVKLTSLKNEQIREYWWALNRNDVWKAITCDAKGFNYFRHTCGTGEKRNATNHDCRCDGDQVPTYFDYVPQYLRWFEEWAEDFCRLRKRKLEDAIKKCRGDNGKERYCDLNRYDCKRTASGKHDFFEEDDCIGCHFSCAHFVKWIDNQKLEFLKQKEKYGTEITGGSGRKKRGASTTKVYDGYEKKFYGILKNKGGYNNVDSFLEKLNKEDVCTKNNEIEEGGQINFKEVNSGKNSDGNNKTFARTKICEPCPWCGAEKDNSVNGKWKWIAKSDTECGEGMGYNGYENTKIPILTGDKTKSDMVKKYNKFCNGNGGNGAPGTANVGEKGENGAASGDNSDNATTGYCGTNNKDKDPSLCEKWTCYYKEKKNENNDGKKDINFCVLQDGKQHRKEHKVTSYNAFFWDWVHDMLIDSIKWRDEHGKCINDAKSNQCMKRCKSPCECFSKWVQQKESEWGQIKIHFRKQKDIGNQGHNGGSQMLGLLIQSPDFVLQQVLKKDLLLEIIEGTYGKSKETEHIKQLLDEGKKKKQEASVVGGKDNTTIDKLLKHEKGEAKKCKENNPLDKCQPTKIRNPCSGDKTGDQRYEAVAQTVAKILQQKAHKKMMMRSRNDKGESALKGDIRNAKFKNNPNPSGLNGVCSITKEYTNDKGGSKNGGPCEGKGKQRFDIGEGWTNVKPRDTTYGDVIMPPRREHMCTSNLEKLNYASVIGSNNVNDTFLVDVLLAAKKEAEFIKKKYNEKQNDGKNGLEGDQVTTCRAIKSSFADIGDIIRGRDMWDRDSGSREMEGHLKKIFNTIRQKLPTEIEGKYKKDEDPYKQLREDWWEANRETVWEAMKCKTSPSVTTNCDKEPTPIDDHIPQRLRWMTEWAEWFCKAQEEAYGELMQKCSKCKDKIKGQGQCKEGTEECTDCKSSCEKYTEFVNKWEDQWNTMQIPYALSYRQAENGSAGKAFLGTDPDYKQVVDFFEQLQEKYKTATSGSATNSPYATPAGYIHQEARTGECLVQKYFCNNNGNNEKYAFQKTPPQYKDACECKPPQQENPGRSRGTTPRSKEDDNSDTDSDSEEEEEEEEEEEDVCVMAKELIQRTNGGTTEIDGCKRKENYPEWNCAENSFLSGNEGTCMPPRRQKLCLYYIGHDNETKNIITDDNLKDAFIKTAAAETFHAWHYYKKKNSSSGNLDEKLEQGEIPEEFLRSMFFTYADYRDILFNTDISAKTDKSHVKSATDNIVNFFRRPEGKSSGGLSQEQWWQKYGEDIWEGMLCGLTHGVTNTDKKKNILDKYSYDKLKNEPQNGNASLEDFAKKPQFLRWMIEWGEEFCRERKRLEDNIKVGCREGDACNNTQHRCKTACTEFQDYVKKKYGEFFKQTTKFLQNVHAENAHEEYKHYKTTEGPSKQGNDYLKDKCDNNKCSCMDGNVLSVSPKEKPFGIYSHEYKNKCDCYQGKHSPAEVKPPPQPPQETPQEVPREASPSAVPKKPEEPQNNECTIVENLFEGEGKTKLKEACAQKYSTRYPGWKCNSGTSKTDKDGGSVCIPPRRQKLYLKYLQELTDGTSREALRQAFIQSAAVETFFLWHKYKAENTKTQSGGVAPLQLFTGTLGDGGEKTPETSLKSGKIPPDFLRQMFYTLGDYRDICIGGDRDIVGDTIVSNTEGSSSSKIKISEKIKQILSKQSATRGSHSGTTPQQTWWENNAKHIWRGMVCALTYKENGARGPDGKNTYKIEQIQDANGGEDLFKKLKNGNDYEKVQLGEEEASGEKTPLDSFIKRPPYFRYLEEWGQNFCKERMKRLDQIYEDCKVGDDDNKCDGDGFECTQKVTNEDETIKGFDCPSCANSCRWYKKWIEKKKTEFKKQEKAYDGQKKQNCKEESESSKQFCVTLDTCNTAGEFLERLKFGPCKNNNNGADKLDFANSNKIFVHAKDCGTCPEFKINCNGNSHCSGGGTQVKCKNKNSIGAGDIEQMRISTQDVDMRVSHNGENGFGDLQNDCQHAGIFEGIKENKYKCGEYCGLHVCGLKGDNGGKNDQIILVRALFKRWVHNFLEDYNIIRTKLKSCIENGNGSICTSDCGKKCKCVGQWIEKKKEEWEKIKKRFLEQYKKPDNYNVRSVLEDLIPENHLVNVEKKLIKLSQFDNSCGCSADASSEKKKNGEYKDAIECMLDKLGKKAKKCETQNSGEEQKPCEESSPEPDDEPFEEEETENTLEPKKMMPTFCKIEETKETVVDEGTCDAVDPGKEKEKVEKESEKPLEDESVPPGSEPEVPPTKAPEAPPSTPAKTKESKKPKSTKKPQIKTLNVLDHPAVIPALMSSTIMWSIGIGFATFTYFYLKIRMKKKKKRKKKYKKKFIKIKKKKKKERKILKIIKIIIKI